MFFLLLQTNAQKQVKTASQGWVSVAQHVKFSKKLGATFDVQTRTKDNFDHGFSLYALRGGMMYFLTKDITLTAGYANFNYILRNKDKSITQPEHRPWQQLIINNNYGSWRTQHRIRLEERFKKRIESNLTLGNGYGFNYRAGYYFSVTKALGKKPFEANTFAFMLADEVLINFGKEVVYNTFDQNRLMAGLCYYATKNDVLQLQYMNVFQQGSNGNLFKNIHVTRLTYAHTLNLTNRLKS